MKIHNYEIINYEIKSQNYDTNHDEKSQNYDVLR